jgi:hypothetical protein
MLPICKQNSLSNTAHVSRLAAAAAAGMAEENME